jgi:hypothetical protein
MIWPVVASASLKGRDRLWDGRRVNGHGRTDKWWRIDILDARLMRGGWYCRRRQVTSNVDYILHQRAALGCDAGPGGRRNGRRDGQFADQYLVSFPFLRLFSSIVERGSRICLAGLTLTGFATQ